MSLGSRIKEYRKKRGYTQSQMASQLNMTEANFSSYERDKSTPPGDKVSKIASILNVSTDYLLGKTQDPTPSNYFIFNFNEDGENESLEIRELSEKERQARKIMLVEGLIDEQINQLSKKSNNDAKLIVDELINLRKLYTNWASNKYRTDLLKCLDNDSDLSYNGVPISQSEKDLIRTVISSMFNMKKDTDN
ncbi:helix-turn-helix domain-containing protein [Paenibacillus glucanolyticus]|uniref:helix-turn-helix domain-containing protein n=1 Tax=Paenibacillus glucanolyticus TaxID=59843 RepID=UPI00128E1ED1|nr:helix-turn-helix domain-containing protein [Paenibacillus glucanolyticus]MPY15823.1 helix-turn-helix domain-containing protein [Paenibacillus glucanolyticus]